MAALKLSETSLEIDGERVDVRDPGAARRLCELAGPVLSSAPIEGVGRTVHALASGMVLLTRDLDGALLYMCICFAPDDFNPYPKLLSEVPAFVGRAEGPGWRVAGGESVALLSRFPGIHGFGGWLVVDQGELHARFRLERRRTPFGKRTGAKRLVALMVEWGGIKGFPS